MGVSLRYESTNRGQKFSKSKNFSTFFKTDFLHVSRLCDKFWQEKFLTKKIVQSPSIATRSRRQKLPFACYQRRWTLPVRIAWQGGWHLGVSLRYKSTNRGQKFSKSKNFSTFFKTDFLHVSRLWDKFWQEKFLTKKLFKVPVSQRDPKGRNSPLHVIREGDSPCSDRMARGLELGCLIAIREYKSRSKIF